MPKRTRTSEDEQGAPSEPSGGGSAGRNSGAGKLRSGGLRFKDNTSNPTSSSAAKRTRAADPLPALSLEGSLSEEILLRCLHFLSAHDLVTVSRVSSAWHRLTQDPQLWRDLYLRTYASASTRRQVLAGGSFPRTRPWRELFKVSRNWRSGSARTSTLGKGLRQAVLPEAPPDLELRTSSAAQPASPPSRATASTDDVDTLLQFHHHLFFTASRSPVSSPSINPPTVTVHQTLPSGDSAVVGSFSSSTLREFFSSRPTFRPPVSITEMRLDETPSSSSHELLFALFYSTSQFSLFRLTLPSFSSPSFPFSAREVYTSLALGSPLAYPTLARSTSPYDPVQLARLNGSLLVTCSESLMVRFWRISDSGEGALHVDEAETPLQTSERSWQPVVLSLTKVGQDKQEEEEKEHDVVDQQYRATLAYSTPVFPESWTVGMQEFLITVPLQSSSSRPRLSITARHATAPPILSALPPTPRRTSVFSTSSSPVSRSSTSSPVTGLEHHHPFLVTSRSDNQLDVYEVVSAPPAPPPTAPLPLSPRFPSSTPPFSRIRLSRPSLPSPPQLKLEHRRTLFGHTARVTSVALVDGTSTGLSAGAEGAVRCISAGDDGAVKVWELTPSGSGSGKKRKRGGAGVEEVVDVQAAPEVREEEGGGETAWKRMKRRRMAGLHGRGEEAEHVPTAAGGERDRPERVKRVMVGEDKIVLVGAGEGGAGESVRVLRFD
ncbi:hypothetical protein JCM8547_008481 [Rhodosporidiobolus lusitaniae]